MSWLRFLGRGRRRRSPWNNVGADGTLTCGRLGASLLLGGEIGPRDWEALSEAGVSVVVNMQEEQQDIFSPYEKLDGYLWLPAPDGRAPSVPQLAQGVAFVQAAINNNRKVFVHCKAGQGRAPLLCACYLIADGATTMDAIKRVQAARPSTQLSPEQSVRLREFAHYFAHAGTSRTPFDKALAHSKEAGPEPDPPGDPADGGHSPASSTPGGAQGAAPVSIPAVAPVAKP